MTWLVPSVIATLIGTVILVAVYWHMYLQERSPELRLWTIAWGLYAGRFVFMLAFILAGSGSFFMIGAQLSAIWSGVMLLKGAYAFADKRFPRWLPPIAGALSAYTVILTLSGATFLWLTLPSYALLGCIYVWTGLLFLRHPDKRFIESRITGWAFVIWGVHKADYPIVRPLLWLAPWGYMLAAALEFIVAITVLLLYLRRARTQLQDSEERFRTLFHSVMDPVYVSDDQGNFADVNPAACERTGYSREQLLTMHVADIDVEITREKLNDALDDDAFSQPTLVSRQHKAVDGEVYPVDVGIAGFEWHGRRFLVATARDMTDRVRMEQELRINAKRLQAMVDLHQKRGGSPNELASLALDKALELTGSELGFFQLISPTKNIGIPVAFTDSVLEQCRMHRDQLHFDLDHSGRWADVVHERAPLVVNDNPGGANLPQGHAAIRNFIAVPVLDEGTVVAVAAVANKDGDYTDQDVHQLQLLVEGMWSRLQRMEQQQRIEEAKDRAESANRAKSAFLANMSHELRTPLNGAMGVLQVLEETPLAEEQRHLVKIAHQSCANLTQLLNDILDISRVEAGKLEIQTEQFNLETLLNLVRETLAYVARGKLLDFSVSIDPDLPAQLIGDPVRIRQILLNLAGNAVKFTESGYVRIEASRLPANGPGQVRVLFTVEDTGPGMSDELMARAFDPFTQADTSHTRLHQGAGLGLQIVKRLARLMNASIALDSRHGEGVTAYFAITLLKGEDAPALSSAAPQPQPAARSSAILLAEDDPVNSLALTRYLTKHGYSVHRVENGREAVDALAADHYDCVLMDMQMPVMDGGEATASIRARPDHKANTPIVAVTAHAMSGDEERILAAGIDAYVAKPVDLPALLSVLEECLESSARGEGSGQKAEANEE